MANEAALKLVALDADDLEIISAHLQDGVLRVGEMRFLPAEQRFAVTINRFDWLSDDGSKKGTYRRRQSALVIDRVSSVKSQFIKRDNGEAALALLSVVFSPDDAPSGHIDLTFAGGGAVKLEVECIEARLADLGPEWETQTLPVHDLSETDGTQSDNSKADHSDADFSDAAED